MFRHKKDLVGVGREKIMVWVQLSTLSKLVLFGLK